MEEYCCGKVLWLYAVIVVGLVLFAGLMSGLSIGLMSIGLFDLEVLLKSGTPQDQKYAAKILSVAKNQHLLLCTLLIGNSLAIEALPLFLDALLETWAAILISVTLILFFGEILPQAVCAKYGLAVSATMVPFVRMLILLFLPVTYPISKLLDWMLGKTHDDLFRREELMTLIKMHANEAGKGGELTNDETMIMTGALKLTRKSAKDAMTPIASTFCIDVNAKLDRNMMNLILRNGHSRVPVYSGNTKNIIGLILVKSLIATCPEEELIVREHVRIHNIPRVAENMPLYSILNEFRKGQSHMAVVINWIKQINAPDKGKGLESQSNGKPDNSGIHVQSCEQKVLQGSSIHTSPIADIVEEEHATEPGEISNPHSLIRISSPITENLVQPATKSELTSQADDIPNKKEQFKCHFRSAEEVIGIITMEDIIEELLQEEVLNESDAKHVHNKVKSNMVRMSSLSPHILSSMPTPRMSPSPYNHHMLVSSPPTSNCWLSSPADSPFSAHFVVAKATPEMGSPNK